ncbi:MAG: tetratricopeptide repeat protein [Pseudomonadota bacterium]
MNKTSLHKSSGKVAMVAALLASVFALPAHAESTADAPPSTSLAGNYLAARVAASDKDTESAAKFYRQALKLDNDNGNLQLQSFLNFVANGDFAEAVKLGEGLSERANSPQIVSLVQAVEELRQKSWTTANKALDEPWRSALDRLIAGLLSGWSQVGQQNMAEALKTVDALKGPAWFDLFTQYHGGLMAHAAGDDIEAVRRLEIAYANRAGGQAAIETYMRVVAALSQAYWRAGKKEQARNTIAQGLERAPQNPMLEALMAQMERDQEPVAMKISPQRGAAEVFLNLGTALDKEGGEQFARIYLQMARVLAPKDAAVTSKLAEQFDKQNQLVRANSLFEEIDEASPLHRVARLEIALNLDELEQVDEARAEMDKLIAAHPDDLVTHLSYGAVLSRHEKYDDAIEVYKKIIARVDKPERYHWNLFYRLGIAYERTKRWPMAEKTFKRALELYPDQPNVLNYLGYSWVDQNVNLQEGLDMIRKAVELRPSDGYIVDSLGWAYYRLGRFEEAVVELERAVELRPGDPTINDHLGDAYWKAKRRLEATFQWQHALALDPPEADVARIEDKLENGLDVVLERETAASENKPDNG